jgi:ABC-type transport system involved in multi-copper enzyme maturation permease subunit
MQFPPLPADLAIIVAGLASIISSWLRDDGLSARLNGLIAVLALVVAAAACIFLTVGFSGNLKDDTTLLIAVAFTLAGKEFFVLMSYLQAATSPLAPEPVPTRSSVRPTAQSWPKSTDGE